MVVMVTISTTAYSETPEQFQKTLNYIQTPENHAMYAKIITDMNGKFCQGLEEGYMKGIMNGAYAVSVLYSGILEKSFTVLESHGCQPMADKMLSRKYHQMQAEAIGYLAKSGVSKNDIQKLLTEIDGIYKDADKTRLQRCLQ